MNVPFAAHSRRPARLAMLSIAAVALACIALPTRGIAQCVINGPDNVAEGARFTLCAPSGYTYRWTGPGVPAGVTSRCITLSGRPTGLYEYTVTLSSGGGFQDRCTQTVAVGDNPSSGSNRPEDQCTITGPSVMASGETVQLCGTVGTYDVHTYSWTGPGGYRATTRCISVSRPGDYTLTTRNQVTGHERTCTQRVDLTGGGSGTGDCDITGPDSVTPGTRVRLCGPSGAYSYRWTGPGNLISTSSCVTVNQEGTYTLQVRDRYGNVRECTQYLDATGGPNDADETFAENCPRNYVFWSAVCRGSRSDVSASEMRSIARFVDEHAQAFSWTGDADGLCQTLRPAGPLTQRKQAARQLAALYANLGAAELGITAQNGQTIGLDGDTPISFRNARTIGELAALVDRMLVRGRGSFATVNSMMQSVNSGRGIGSVCNP
jgi:hypothetical protein